MAAEKKGILIVTSPYTVHFEKTANYFKPGLPFEVVVYVTNPDNTPAKNIDLEMTPGPVFGRTGENGAAKFQVNTPQEATTLQVNVRTKAPGIAEERQAAAQMTAQPYRTQGDSKNYMYISILSRDIQIGNSLNIHIVLSNSPSIQDQINHLTYLVLSKGQLIRAARYKRLTGQSIIAINDEVTKDMVPSFRIVAYYHVGTEVVSDSIWVDVKDTCMGTLEVTATEPKDVYEPRQFFSLTITGDPGATVGLVAVDKGVHVLNSKHRLTQTKIWEIVEKHDIGCAPGSGADSMGVFYDAGLAFQSNSGGTSRRLEPNCPTLPKSRRRRSLGEEDDHYISDTDIVSRTLFPGSWLWEDMMLPVCPRDKPGCKSTSITRRNFLKDTITTWEITAISLSETHGICVSDPFEMTAMKNFFIDLKLPYAAVRNEQLEIEAVIHNYLYKQIKVRVELMETSQVCSAASKQRKYRVPEVLVDSMSSRAVPFVIIPMALGLHPIEVKAADNDSFSWDGVKKNLLVVPEGAQYRQMTRIVLNPSLYGSVQKVEINAQRPTSQVPGTDGYNYIIVTGEQQSQTIQEVISGSSISHLIAQPRGNGEQNIMSMTGPVIATHYLDNTDQWDKVAQDRQDVLKFIEIGYTQQLAYRNKEGAYSVSTGRNPSSWLTAYVVKVFSLANTIKEEGLCHAIKWLLLHTQQPDGSFKEVGHVDHGEMLGGVQGKDNDVSMTAFILIAIQEAQHICVGTVYALQDGLRRTHEFLSSQIKSLTDPYAVALTAYALANEGKHQIEILNHFSSGKTHWQVSNSPLITLEATGYALMALVRAKEFDQAARVVEWLTEQKFYGGGDPKSTQATIIVLQAVAMFTREVSARTETELRVHLTLARPVTWVFSGNSGPIIRSQRVHLGTNVTLTAEGSGKASLLVVLTAYNALPEEKEEDCKNFELNVALEKEPRGL
ncbi:hypothetical protein GJAV_G00265920 [Gymnothorax javanicus]|nr:hypothetical protein GJAV_G00265920 [Gymnothorax javanicus]